MKKIALLSFALCISSLFSFANDIDTLKKNIRQQLIGGSSEAALLKELTLQLFPNGADTDLCLKELVADRAPSEKEIIQILSLQKGDGSFEHVDYTSTSRSAWPTLKHLEMLMKMAKAYRSPQSPLYNDSPLSAAIHRGMNYWCHTLPECPNWWYNEIGAPKVFAPLMILMEDELSPQQLAAGINVLDRSQLKMTGQNKVWLAGIVFMKGLLLYDPQLLTLCSDAIHSELIVTTNEGIQPDYSFHQHGAQQQFGNYGLAFASSQSYWMRILSGTKYDFSTQQKEHLRNYMLRGLNLTIWKGIMDISACGRQLFVNAPRGKAASLLLSMSNMMIADPQYKQQYQEYITRNFVSLDNQLISATHYWRSDYTVYRAPHYMITVKMCSPRVIGSESTNRENLLGFYSADGATYTYCSGKEYENIFPLWHWKQLPGTTTTQSDQPIPFIHNRDKDFSHENKSPFVGGVTHHSHAVSALDLHRDGVTGRKGWFFVGDQVVCLGANLLNNQGLSMTTSIEQSLLQGSVLTSDQAPSPRAKNEWFLHNGIGYRSLQPQTIVLHQESTPGNWNRVADFYPSQPISKPLFLLYIHHQAGTPASYAYSIHPNCDKPTMLASIKEKRIKILTNTANQQSVEDPSQTLVQSICYTPTSIKSSLFPLITVSHPCILMIHRNPQGKTTLSVADPTQQLTELTISIGKRKHLITFPSDGMAGSSVHTDITI